MNQFLIYVLIFLLLFCLELCYFKIADRYNIIDKPNERSSHSTIVLRGGGIIFTLGAWIWLAVAAYSGEQVLGYLPFLVGLTIAAGISFVDDIHSLHDGVRLVAQFVGMVLMFWSIGIFGEFDASAGLVHGVIVPALIILVAFIVSVGATNIINFMDGINGITGAYALATLVPLLLTTNCIGLSSTNSYDLTNTISESFLVTMILVDIVFCFFNFRPKGKAKCFAGDVGSIAVAFILLFGIGKIVMATGDVTYLVFLLVYGVDGCLTICHRIMLHENLGEAHRKHAYQLMANELRIGHVKVSLFYAMLQLIISLGFIYLCPNTALAHWLYLAGALVILSIAYVVFMKRCYYLHEEYLASLKR